MILHFEPVRRSAGKIRENIMVDLANLRTAR